MTRLRSFDDEWARAHTRLRLPPRINYGEEGGVDQKSMAATKRVMERVAARF